LKQRQTKVKEKWAANISTKNREEMSTEKGKGGTTQKGLQTPEDVHRFGSEKMGGR